MTLSPSIQHLRDQLHQSVEHDLTPKEWVMVKFAKADIQEVVSRYGEAGQVALSLAAADFAAE